VADADGKPLLSRSARIGLWAGIAVLLLTIALPPPSGLSVAGWRTLGLALMMAIWWSTEPVPMAVTALLPLVVMPLAGIADMNAAAAPFANPIVFLFFGGFLLSNALSRWGLHRRIAFAVISAVGTSPRRIVLGFMVATAFLSMWITNTSTVLLMLPVAAAVIGAIETEANDQSLVKPFALALLLGIAYAASIGGIGTLIGTAPNALLTGYLLKQHQIDVPFIAWMAVGVPVVVTLIPLTWLIMTRFAYRVSPSLISDDQSASLIDRLTVREPMRAPEWRVALLLLATALAWITRPLLNTIPGLESVTDAGIAVTGAFLLFLVPSGDTSERRFLLNWREAQDIPWQVLLLFGGGLSLAGAMDGSGLARWIGDGLGQLGNLPALVFILMLVATVIFLTELASNTAIVAALLPVVAAIASQAGMDFLTVATALTIAASCAFMLPVATPPNALIFATGRIAVANMMWAGIWLNILATLVVTLFVSALVPLALRG
jgi:solute carrier family 13 (sodium-dependent dicarboxylate transporter), member 2/3/5